MRSAGCRRKSPEQTIRSLIGRQILQAHVRASSLQAFLAKLNKADSNFPSVKKAEKLSNSLFFLLQSTTCCGSREALKTGAKIDWRNPELLPWWPVACPRCIPHILFMCRAMTKFPMLVRWDGATLLLRAARTGSLELAMPVWQNYRIPWPGTSYSSLRCPKLP